MKLNDYQYEASKTAIYPKDGINGLLYTSLGLGEVGEFQGKVKKILRDDNGKITLKKRQELVAELGDIMWYVAMCATELEVDLDDVCKLNLAKLTDRKKRGVISGSGDNR